MTDRVYTAPHGGRVLAIEPRDLHGQPAWLVLHLDGVRYPQGSLGVYLTKELT